MLTEKKEHPKLKSKLHPRNKHRERYDFKQLINSCPELAQFIISNIYNDESIDFSNPEAVKILNKALLKHDYGIDNWNFPKGYLCPPIPGRADYIHHLPDLLASVNNGKIPTGNLINCLDIGVGASCIYPIIGHKEYGWSFVGTDIDPVSIESANGIIESNLFLKGEIEIRFNQDKNNFFSGMIEKNEHFDLTICNPPFHASEHEAQLASMRKVSNLKNKRITKPILNFGGVNTELWCKGGEERFVQDMIRESKSFAASCFWFSTLISKESNLNKVYQTLAEIKAFGIKTIYMGQGNKISRIVAWTFQDREEQKKWALKWRY